MPLKPDPRRRTFQETYTELGLTQDDLMRCVAEGKIIPMVLVQGYYTLYSIEDGPDGKPFEMELCTEGVNGSYFLVHRRQKTPTSCIWRGFSVERTADDGESYYLFNDEAYRSEFLPERCYFLVEDIECFRMEHVVSDRMNTKAAADVASRERTTTMYKLILGMATAYHAYDRHQARSSVPSDIAAELQRAGYPLHVDTIRDLLKNAARHVAPDQLD